MSFRMVSVKHLWKMQKHRQVLLQIVCISKYLTILMAKKEKDRDLFIMACISVINKDCIIDLRGEVCPQRIRERKKKRLSVRSSI